MARSTESQVNYYNRYLDGILPTGPMYDYSNKKRCISQHIAYMLNRTQSMFEWQGLPDTVPARSLELYLQVNGNACWYRYKGDLYVFTGGLGGQPDPYYMPTIYTVANPALQLSVSLEIGKECVVMPNDSMYMGLIPMYSRYATGLTENELSLKLAVINSRIVSLISAPDDRTKKSADKYLEDIDCGKMGSIAENAFLNGIRAQPYAGTSNSNSLTNLIEVEQYLKASWFNELGLDANYNMKRESLNSAESQMNDDALLPLVDDMLKCRKLYAEQVNKMFGTSITVDYGSMWKRNAEAMETNPEAEQEAEQETEQETEQENSARAEDEEQEAEEAEEKTDDDREKNSD